MLQRLLTITNAVIDASETVALTPVRILSELKVPDAIHPGRLVDAVGLLFGITGADLLTFLGPNHDSRVERLVPLLRDLSPTDLDDLLLAFADAAAIAGIGEDR